MLESQTLNTLIKIINTIAMIVKILKKRRT